MVYVLRMSGTKCYKIGFTSGVTPDIRIASLQTSCPYKLELIGILKGGTEFDERCLQSQFVMSKTDGGDEWFELDDSQIEYLSTYLNGGHDEHNNYQCPDSGTSAFNVRPICGGQQHEIGIRRENVLDKGTPFDNARDQPVFPLMRRERQISLPSVFWQER